MNEDYQSRATTKRRILKRSCESLLGICQGVMADGCLNDKEIAFLDNWLANNEQLAKEWPGNILSKRIQKVIADEIISEEEREHLKSTLKELLGGTMEENGVASGLSTRLSLDKETTVAIPGKSFCFTGKFIFGPRKQCEQATEGKGGLIFSKVRTNLNYLVVGPGANPAWKYSNYGIKYKDAMAYKEKGHAIQVVVEEQWADALGTDTR